MNTLHGKVVALMADGKARSYADMKAALSLTDGAIRAAIFRMKKKGQIYVSGWIPSTHGNPSPIYCFGKGMDVEYERPVTTAEQKKIWRARILERERERLSPYDRPVARDPFIAVLFGAREAIKATVLPSHTYRQPMDYTDDMEAA